MKKNGKEWCRKRNEIMPSAPHNASTCRTRICFTVWRLSLMQKEGWPNIVLYLSYVHNKWIVCSSLNQYIGDSNGWKLFFYLRGTIKYFFLSFLCSNRLSQKQVIIQGVSHPLTWVITLPQKATFADWKKSQSLDDDDDDCCQFDMGRSSWKAWAVQNDIQKSPEWFKTTHLAPKPNLIKIR